METIIATASELVEYADHQLEIGDANLSLDGLSAILIVTTDQGPILDDVFLMLHLPDKRVVVSSTHPGFMDTIEALNQDYTIDYNQVIASMCCAQNARFVLWSSG
ncbi:MAG: hypothetical protein LBR44_03100 [Clostridiales Family XIII bacterium]|jgi:hypothetical protein|nr:hypothetical protein [Clostridiales Family XIII bacterium]